ncbi:hypothetical protein H6G91_31745 [Nostoc muscorum FACHB-395]|jgi:aspartokinase|nr:hypothetical protein [Desmonostoc muscorum FACHB-395]
MIFSFLLLGLLSTTNLSSVPLGLGHGLNNQDVNYYLYTQNQAEDSPTQTNQDFTFKLTGCNRSSSFIKCDFIIQNNKYDRGLVIYAKYGAKSSRLIDTSGNEALATEVTIGQKTNKAYVGANMLRDVPVKATILFDGFATDNIRVIAISAYDSEKNKRFEVKFQ